MATEIITASVEVGFDRDWEYQPTKITFEMDDTADFEQFTGGVVRVRHYPGYPLGVPEVYGYSYVTNKGSLYFTNELRERRVEGVIIFNGTTEADLPYPVESGLTLSPDGQLFSDRGREVYSVSIMFDRYRQKVIASRPIYGPVRYSYVTSYRVCRYFPGNYYGDAVFYEVDEANYGQVLAFPRSVPLDKDLNTVAFNISPPSGSATQFELMRVTSSALATEDGMYEPPPGWKNRDFTYPDGRPALATDTYLEIERVHKIYYLIFGDPNRSPAMQSYASSSTSGLVEKNANSTYLVNVGRKIIQQDAYIKLRQGKVRSVVEQHKYEIPWAKPYDVDLPEPVTLVRELTIDGHRVRTTMPPIVYKRQLTVKASRLPSSEIPRSTAQVDEYQSRVNEIMSALWKGIHWQSFRQEITGSFDPLLYNITFDSSVPTS